ncbi:MAG: hypothetical protein B7Y80_09535 [Hyphomicrobium sp. 32-62-53]|nr:MAG: hypothetical protein B7Z29_09180 [Hyphomicrobium sp. 12-62-95]OYX99819.1 MAG: hypothetical protein B7Y80_09535 [Hyphomicrobium sp. 32-62-53]
MNRIILATLILAASHSVSSARDLSTKVMQDNPGVSGAGTTTNPTAKPETGGLAEHAMRISPGVNGPGTTANPTAKPAARGLAEKAMQDHPGVSR